MKTKIHVACAGLSLLALLAGGCNEPAKLIPLSQTAQLEIALRFNPQARAKTAPAAQPGTILSTPITRATATVIEQALEDTVVRAQELDLVTENGQKFAEGQLLIPVTSEEQSFTILIAAFDGTRLFSKGEAEVSLSPGEVRETPLTVNMLQFPSVFNARQQLLGLNNCNLGDGGALASSFQVDFDFTDADGDVVAGSAVTVTFQFVDGNTGTFVVTAPGLTGSGSQGSVSTNQCYRFGTTESVNVSMTLTDSGGLTSEPFTLTIDRPQGANRTVESAGDLTPAHE